MHAELARVLATELPHAELRGNVHTKITAGDLEWADTYVGFRRPPVATMGGVRWVHCTGAGVDAWLYPVELPPDILLTRTNESFGPMIAEWAIARALAFTQRLLPLAEQQSRREWRDLGVSFVRGSRALVVGTGDVGAHIARAFKALGAHVEGMSRSGRGDAGAFDAVHPVSELGARVAGADWLVLALPLTRLTERLVSRDILRACRGAVLINAGRGGVVEETAIPHALERGWLKGAALDVFEVEPLTASSPLWSDPRVMISPHSSGPTTLEGAAAGFLDCVRSLERAELPVLTVDRARQY